mgnify:CR=1 FL=1
MFLFRQKTPYEKEITALLKKERRFLKARENKKESFINRQLEKVVPQKLRSTLDSAFAKAFGLIFEKGTKVRIIGGNFNGVEGVFVKVKGKRSKRVVIMLDKLCAVAMAEVDSDLIEVIKNEK